MYYILIYSAFIHKLLSVYYDLEATNHSAWRTPVNWNIMLLIYC